MTAENRSARMRWTGLVLSPAALRTALLGFAVLLGANAVSGLPAPAGPAQSSSGSMQQLASVGAIALPGAVLPRRAGDMEPEIHRGTDAPFFLPPDSKPMEDLGEAPVLSGNHRLTLEIKPGDTLMNLLVEVRREADGFTADTIVKPTVTRPARAEGRIDSSLMQAGIDAGVPASVMIEMIRIYSFDVDFQRDIQKGDSFEVMYERLFDEDGAPVHDGAVRYAALTLSGKTYRLYLFEGEDGARDYFNEKGASVRKALLRTPVDGARISSTFGKRRHPILVYTKMHKGTDFAAPSGTPIMAAGDGVVEKAGRNGGYGNYIRIRHNGTYKTAYAHLSKFARGVRAGSRVRQGDIIGYVGTTGRSTGPHLHYEVLMEQFQASRAEMDRTYAGLSPLSKMAEN
jgi:murein DD-endopeptidase MepM/ murein hydrolase activator NlpD